MWQLQLHGGANATGHCGYHSKGGYPFIFRHRAWATTSTRCPSRALALCDLLYAFANKSFNRFTHGLSRVLSVRRSPTHATAYAEPAACSAGLRPVMPLTALPWANRRSAARPGCKRGLRRVMARPAALKRLSRFAVEAGAPRTCCATKATCGMDHPWRRQNSKGLVAICRDAGIKR